MREKIDMDSYLSENLLEKENSFLLTRGECHCDSKTIGTHIDYCDTLASVWMQESLKGDDCLI
jgi:hypothetical protein